MHICEQPPIKIDLVQAFIYNVVSGSNLEEFSIDLGPRHILEECYSPPYRIEFFIVNMNPRYS